MPVLTVLRDKLIKGILERGLTMSLAGHPSLRLPNNVNFVFEYIDGRTMLFKPGYARRSAAVRLAARVCEPVARALAMVSRTMAHGSLRLTPGHGQQGKRRGRIYPI